MAAQNDLGGRVMIALNGDVVDYSRLMADDLEATSAAVDGYHRLVEQLVSRRGGRLVNFVGDNFMALFGDPMAAIEVAIGISHEVELRNDPLPDTRRVRFRLGLDRGAVTDTSDDVHGDVLNIAARIQAIAPAGGICVSGAVYRALDEPALRFRPLGRRDLKNIPEPVEVYEFADLPTDDGSRHAATSRLALETPTVAVLPVHSEGVEEAVRRTADLLRRDLVHRLSRIPGLNVIDAGRSPEERPHDSAARYMLESGVHQFGEEVRVFVTLFDVTTVNVVKSHKWTAPAAGMLELSDRVSDEVARAIEVDLIVGEPAGLYAELDDPVSVEKVYLGWYHLRNEKPEDWQRAIDLFGEVVEAHPDQPYGPVLLAFAYWMGAAGELAPDPGAALVLAKENADVARRIGDPTGMAVAVDAAILMAEGRNDEALAVMEDLEIARPTCDVTYGLEGSVRRYLGEWEKAAGLMDVAMRLTGLNKPWYPTVKACSSVRRRSRGRGGEPGRVRAGVSAAQPRGSPGARRRAAGARPDPACRGHGRAAQGAFSRSRRGGLSRSEPVCGHGRRRTVEGRPRSDRFVTPVDSESPLSRRPERIGEAGVENRPSRSSYLQRGSEKGPIRGKQGVRRWPSTH